MKKNANEETGAEILSLPKRADVEEEAASWIVRLENDPPRELLAEFRAWRARSDLHRDCFDRMTDLWGGLDIAANLKRYERRADPATAVRFTSRRAIFALAASVAAVAGVGGALYASGLFARPWEAAYATTVGERKTVTLPDGSAVELNTATRIQVAMGRSSRDVRLLAGEAYFDVAHDADRPFSVHANENVVTAVGTAFAVRLKERLIDVTVAQGRVRLSAEPGRDPAPRAQALGEIAAGETALLGEKIETRQSLQPEALSRRLSWRDGLLAFAGEQLADVVADISRYTDVTIEIDDESLRAMPVRGYFRVGEVDAMLEALQEMADISVVRISDTHVRITRTEKA